jgi:hypothetical protein
VGEVSVPSDLSAHPNPKRDWSGKESQLLETHGRLVQRYDEHPVSDLKVINHGIDIDTSDNNAQVRNNTEIFVSHKWTPRAETQTGTKRPSRARTARVVGNIKSLGNSFVTEEVDNERQSFGANDVLPRNRKRPLVDGGVSAFVSGAKHFSVQSAADSESGEVAPDSFNEAVQNKLWRDSMSAEIKALKNRGCWRVIRTPRGTKLIKSKYVYRIKKDWAGKIIKRKSRLVVQGFSQVEGIDFSETFAPVAKVTTFRLMLALTKVLNLHIHQLDVDSAFYTQISKKTSI